MYIGDKTRKILGASLNPKIVNIFKLHEYKNWTYFNAYTL